VCAIKLSTKENRVQFLYFGPYWPGKLQNAVVVFTDENGEVLEQRNCLIAHTIEYEIHEKAFEVHGISKEMCAEKGFDPIDILRELLMMMDKSDKVIAHNLQFDWDMVSKDHTRYKVIEPLPAHHKAFCTMKTTTAFCNLPGQYGPKYRNCTRFSLVLSLMAHTMP